MKTLLLLMIVLTLIMQWSCISNESPTVYVQIDSVVYATCETEPVISAHDEDAADDPAIWVNQNDPSKSLIIGTNKKGGINLYNTNGDELAYYPLGLVNNVDLRYGFRLKDNSIVDIIGATNRTDNSLVIMRLDGEKQHLVDIAARKIISKVGEVYGFSLYHDIPNKKIYAFVGGKMGETEQYELFSTDSNKIDARLLRTFSFPSQSEGMVADDELGVLYVAEEDHCIWKIDANPKSDTLIQKVANTDSLNHDIAYDIEGLTIYYAKNKKGYLIASVQGNFSYALFERTGNNKYLGSFSIRQKGTVDPVEETDGIDVTNLSLGPDYPQGVFIAQDGFNYEGDSLMNQNFKLVPWTDIANLFEPALILDTKYMPGK